MALYMLYLDRRTTARPPVMRPEGRLLTSIRDLDRFLAGVERAAFRIARVALRDDEDAFDVVQDAMLRLARSYAHLSDERWRPLFYKILHNRIRDYRRRRRVRHALFGWLPSLGTADEKADDPMETAPDERPGVVERVMAEQAVRSIEPAVASLPLRQQQAFLLRCLEGLDIAQTAAVMGCSEGSVKTHYSRALQALRGRLGDIW